ncbi:MAG: MerR family transcriptional regulator [Acidimicrobiia bacterium]
MSFSNMFSSKQTCEIVGISYRQLDYWDTKGLFVPTETANGSGSRRRYSFEDLIKLRVIKKMLDNGMKLEEIKRATDFLSRQGIDFGGADLIMTKDNVFLNDANNPGALVDLIKTGQGVFTIVALSQASQDVQEQISNQSSKERKIQAARIA